MCIRDRIKPSHSLLIYYKQYSCNLFRESNLTVLVRTRDPDTAKRMAPHIEVSQEEMRLLCQNSVDLFGSVHLCWISICKSEKTKLYDDIKSLKKKLNFQTCFCFSQCSVWFLYCTWRELSWDSHFRLARQESSCIWTLNYSRWPLRALVE